MAGPRRAQCCARRCHPHPATSRRKRQRRDKRAPIPDFDEPQPRTAGAFLFPNNQKMPARNMTGTAIPPTMNLKEAAETLKIHPHSMEKIIRAGHIPAGRVGRAYVLMTRDVLAYAERIIIDQTAGRINASTTRAARKGRSRAGSRSASASGGFCAQ